GWNVGDEENADGEDGDDGERGAENFRDWLAEAGRRHEEIEADGGSEVAEFHVCEEDDAEANGVYAESGGERNEERDFDDDGGIDFHEAADDEQEEVEEKQKPERGMDVKGGPGDGVGWNFGVDEIVGEAEGDAEDQKNAADKEAAFGHDAGEIAEDPEVAMDNGDDGEGGESGDSGSLHGGENSAEESDERDNGHQKFPLGGPQSATSLAKIERSASG